MNRTNDSHAEKTNATIDNKELEVIKNIFQHPKFKLAQIEIYIEEPYIFVSRIKEKNVVSGIEENRLLLSKGDRHTTRITAIPMELIKDLKVVTYSKDEYEIKFKIKELHYKLWIEL